jgi:hypothetical protein
LKGLLGTENRMERKEVGLKTVDWAHLAQIRDQWWTLVNMAMNLWLFWHAGDLFSS